MLLEINCASEFLCRYLTVSNTVTPQLLDEFKKHIAVLMQEKYTDHWDPQRPHIGNGYRAITSFGGNVDPLLCEAARKSQLPMEMLEGHLPRDLVLWVEPFTVSFRVGDHGSINTIYDGTRGKVTLKPDPSGMANKAFGGRPSHAARISPPPSPPNRAARISHAIPITSPLAKSQVITPSATPSPPPSNHVTSTSTKVAIMAH